MFNKNGTILITSLWIIAILSILAIGIGFRISLEARLSKYNMDRLKALYLAKAGVVKSQGLLSKDTKPDYDSIYECGIALSGEDDPDKIFMNVELSESAEGSFSVSYKEEDPASPGKMLDYPGMMDEERKININTAPKEALEKLPGITDEIASSIMDWRDTDDALQPNGAENSYYQSLEHPYVCKNGNFSAIEELLLVRGMDQTIFEGIKDYITIYGAGKFNINTAHREVLIAFFTAFGGADRTLEETVVDKITNYRNGTDGQKGTKDDNIFIDTNIESVVPGLSANEAAIIGNLKNYFTIESNYFRIESKGIIDRPKIEKRIVSVATKNDGGNFELVSYREY